jgi:hypothetical protein
VDRRDRPTSSARRTIQNHPGRWRSNVAAEGSPDAIAEDVLDRLQVSDRSFAELVREAVEDAIAGRRAGW